MFKDVSVIRKANQYFDGRVTSRTILFGDGSRKTLGIMMPGDYEFGTDSHETMEILAGRLEVLLPGEVAWKTFTEGTVFEVPAGSRFKLLVHEVTDYCCSYA